MTRPDAPLPTGVVTFLLTDIEGSTQAWQTAPDAMTAIVSRHYEILRRGVAAHAGRQPEEQGEGDSIVAVFVDALAAVAAALDTQLALRRDLPDLPVRMALHTGETMLRDENNYVGLTIIRCARIRACGYGGQILLSDAAAGAVRDALPDGLGTTDLGLYGLRGLDGRERIWQLSHPQLPSDFRPLKAGTSAAGNLPTSITSFIGRHSDLVAAGDSLQASRLVTLTGQVGVGKSRLAQAAADATANAMPGGVWWVSLGDIPADDIEAVSLAVIRACALERATDDPLGSIVEFFRSIAESLLVIDGFDRVPAAAAGLIDRVLAHCPDLRVLATGREPLLIAGEVVHRLESMAVPPDGAGITLDDLERFDATRLFVARGVNARAGSPFGDADAAGIAQICRDLHGVPLGIELAAARSGATPVAALASSLASLTDNDGRATGLADALASSIAWTYQFLSSDAQTALRRLGVFHGAFEIDAATTVVAGPPLAAAAAAVAVRRLLDQQLVTFDGESGRLSMSPSIQVFARELLVGSADLPTTTARHGAWFAAVAEHFGDGGADMPESMLGPDLADLLGALDASMVGPDPTVAYRIIGGIGTKLASLGHHDVVETAARWVIERSPSDGEDRWAAAVARLAVSLMNDQEHPLWRFTSEAQAIAEMNNDTVSVDLLARRGAAESRPTDGTVFDDMAARS